MDEMNVHGQPIQSEINYSMEPEEQQFVLEHFSRLSIFLFFFGYFPKDDPSLRNSVQGFINTRISSFFLNS